MNFRPLTLLCSLSLISLAASCIQKLDNGVATSKIDGELPDCGDAGVACNFTPLIETPVIAYGQDDGGVVTDSGPPDMPCIKVILDAEAILAKNCVGCHSPSMKLTSPLTFIQDALALETTPSEKYSTPSPTSPVTYPNYIVPGDPMRSLIYYRAVVQKDMPPMPPRLIPSDASVLADWITWCVPGATGPVHAVSSGGSGGASAAGSGGGGASAAGAGGKGGTSAGGASAAGAGGKGGTSAGGTGAAGKGGAGGSGG